MDEVLTIELMQEKTKMTDVLNTAVEKTVYMSRGELKATLSAPEFPNLLFSGLKKMRGGGEAGCSDSVLESRNQSLPSLLSRFTHACEQHGVCLVLHLVERTILQVL